jgi:glutathione synthase/RimK-type ligase-like ATP-grasp enzyme
MKVLLLTAGNGYHLTGSYNLERLKKSLLLKGIRTQFFGIGGSSSLDDIVELPDIAYIAYAMPPEKLEEVQRFRNRGVFFVNSPEVVALASDKLTVYNKLNEAGVAHPKTIILDDNTNYEAVDLEWPCVIKPNKQSAATQFPCAGLDVMLCNNPAQLKNNVDILSEIYTETDTKIIAQEYTKSGDGDMMISCWVFGDKVSSQITIANSGENISQFKAHRKVGHQRIAIKTSDELLKFLKKISIALNAEIFRVEVFYSTEGYKVCKLKVPGDRLTHDAIANFDSSQIIADYIVRRYTSR